ncbi:ATP-dependent helicase HrpB [Rhodobacteraceae bacterium MBR-64]
MTARSTDIPNPDIPNPGQTPASLPIEAALPDLLAALGAQGRAVLQAPPGAGKTTRVPLALLGSGLIPSGRIVMLEPRRLAARASAERMAEMLNEPVGETVGYRIRGESRVSARTRIEVVTEGILTRRLQSDPGLEGVAAVIFDEFHERSLNADLGLALVWEVRGALRPDLMVLVMSATLDAAPVAALLDAPVITSDGQIHPVVTHWLDRPRPKAQRVEAACADLVARAATETSGGILVFLPGEGEIRRVQGLLQGRLPPDCMVHTLFGAMDFAAQRAAITPARDGRKVVLATSIAETSLTIEDVAVVIDAGLARRARFDPASGMARLVTERVSRAEADQRRGRAGRLGPGTCYRLWTKGEEGALPAFAPAEIEVADLAPLALELALWGARGTADLAFLTPPNPGALAEAQALLAMMGALTAEGRITGHGRALAALPLHPRLAHMLIRAGKAAAPLAALLADRDPLRGAPCDLGLRLAALAQPRADHPHPPHLPTLHRIRDEARRLARLVPDAPALSPAEMAALAYPDRIGLRRNGEAPRWVLSGGKGAAMDAGDPLAAARLIVATDLDGDPREARIRLAIPLADAELRGLYGDQITWQDRCTWSRRDRRVQARQQECFAALILQDRIWQDVPQDAVARAAMDGVRDLGLTALTLPPAVRRLQARAALLRREGADVPDISDAALLATIDTWLMPYAGTCRTLADLKALDTLEPLRAHLGHATLRQIDAATPGHFTTPLGRQVPIDYDDDSPGISIRLQEMFGVTAHPVVGPKHLPLRITLLSPAGKTVQVTTDLPAFWATSYSDVRKDMRGRYPRHPWPENPAEAPPTTRTKPRN